MKQIREMRDSVNRRIPRYDVISNAPPDVGHTWPVFTTSPYQSAAQRAGEVRHEAQARELKAAEPKAPRYNLTTDGGSY